MQFTKKCVMWLFIWLLVGLIGCVQNETNEVTTVQMVEIQTPTPEITTRTSRVCTEMGCLSTLRVKLAGNIPSALIIEVSEPEGMAAVGGCFWTPQDAQGILNPQQEEFGPDDVEEIEELHTFLGGVPLCSQMNASHIEVNRRADGSIYSILAVCSKETGAQPHIRLRCTEEDSVSFLDFTPDQATIKVYTEGEIHEVEATPNYTSFHPNGSGCQPGCKNATVRMIIP